MATAPAVAKKRPKKARTRRTSSGVVNNRPALVVSTIVATDPHRVDLRPGAFCLVCPDCGTWCPITGKESTPKLVPHHTEPAGSPQPRRCKPGSNRLVQIDITLAEWMAKRERFDRDKLQPQSRRPAREFHKPAPPVGSPLGRIAQERPEVKEDHEVSDAHREQCPTCKSRVQLEKERRQFAGRGPAQRARRKRTQWEETLPATQRADMQRVPAGAVSTRKGTDVPLKPLSITR